MEGAVGAHAWYEHLSEHDLELLGRAAPRAGVRTGDVRNRHDVLARLLADEATFDAVFSPADDSDPLLMASPFLVFALIVHRGWVELRDLSSIEEWFGPRRRLPVLSGPQLRDFFNRPDRRLFLTELLASYTRIASGTTWEYRGNRRRRRRFSELDPVQLAALLEVVPESQRPGIYRRLGDLALFLTGIFPDHTETEGIQPRHAERLVRLSALEASPPEATGGHTVGLLEHLGQHWYRLAARTAAQPLTAAMKAAGDIGDQFSLARRALNFLSDRYLFPHRHQWFGHVAP